MQRARVPAALLLALTALAACSSETATSLRVTVDFDAALALDQLRVEVAAGGAGAGPQLVPAVPAAVAPGQWLLVLLPDGWAGQAVTVQVAGLRAGAEVVHGEATTTARLAAVVDVCASGACCTPSCAGRGCGPDPVCGQPCGSCGAAASDCEQAPTCSEGQCVKHPRADGTTCGSASMMYCHGGVCQQAQLSCQDRDPNGFTLYSKDVLYGTGTVYPCPTQGSAYQSSCKCVGQELHVVGSGYECMTLTRTCAACVTAGTWRYCW
ncbi:MAG TPA: hypothetical protein VGQ83_33520 [Polyangia bacterium]|jgi:hypothetical protein